MAYNLKQEMNKPERFHSGHRLCAGCGAGIVCRAMMRAVEPEDQAVICNATGAWRYLPSSILIRHGKIPIYIPHLKMHPLLPAA